ncbi:MAG TPA: acyltransferase [Chitinophagaceae bacterium]|nr:acyltransferase [Chitinophagaceae bacterium]
MSASSTPQKIYFYNLTGLRAIGAIRVLIGHIEFLKVFWGVPALHWFPVGGKIGVTFFFALSGFLITSLLLQERETTHTVKLKKFYLRRILRILPLYYVVILLSIFVFSRIGFLNVPGYTDKMLHELSWSNLLIVLLLLPNVNNFSIPYADQRWSIVVEEQFYFFQPLLIKFLKKRYLLLISFIIIGLSPELVRLFIKVFHLEGAISPGLVNSITAQLKYLACIAMGCVFSVLYFKRESVSKRFFFTKTFQWLLLIGVLGSIAVGHYVFETAELFDYRIYALLFGMIVFNATLNPKTIFKLEIPILNFLGKISYGVYMFHPVCIGSAIVFAKYCSDNLVVQNILIYVLSICVTVGIAWLSFRYFESYFLKLKGNFSILKWKSKKARAIEEPQQN